jgi:hypothetical protein
MITTLRAPHLDYNLTKKASTKNARLDCNLIREILLQLEDGTFTLENDFKLEEKEYYSKLPITNQEIILIHLEYLDKKNMIKQNLDVKLGANGIEVEVCGAFAKIQASGHDFLNKIRNEKTWKEICETIKRHNFEMTVDTIWEIAEFLFNAKFLNDTKGCGKQK